MSEPDYFWAVVTSYGKHWADMSDKEKEEVRKSVPQVEDTFFTHMQFVKVPKDPACELRWDYKSNEWIGDTHL